MGEIRVYFNQTRVVIVGIVDRRSSTAIDSLILFLSTLNETSFTMIKVLFIYMESAGFGDGDFGAVLC